MPVRASHSPEVVVEDLDDDVCLYRPDIDEVVVLNATAGDVWRLADGELSEDELVDRLAAAYQLPAEQVRPDIQSVISDLIERGYLISVDDDPLGAARPRPADQPG